MVGNIEVPSVPVALSGTQLAQSFRTGSNPSGYVLTRIQIWVGTSDDPNAKP